MQQGQKDITDLFVTRLTEAQFSLFHYISLLLGDEEATRDVLQETNLDIWRKAATYDESRPFMPWARALARYQVLTYRKKQSRNRLLFDDELLETVMAYAETDEDVERFAHLHGFQKSCMERLNHFQRAVVEARYLRKESLSGIARKHACSVPAVGMALLRIRRALSACIRKKMTEARL